VIRRPGARTISAGLAGALLAGGGCARQEAPTGGAADRLPPVVLTVSPEPLAQVTDLGATIEVVFNERISERPLSGVLDDAVVVSPETGALDVGHKRDRLEVEIDGGLRPGTVYRVTVLPVIRDMFNNRMRDPFEFVFSTGGELHRNAVVGMVAERITGRPARDLRVQAVLTPAGPDSIVHVARTDSAGTYALRYIPPGRYSLLAFQDRNRSLTPDLIEQQGQRALDVGAGDTLTIAGETWRAEFLNLSVMEGDTTPPRITRAEVVTPTLLRLRFDDYLEPDEPLARVATSLARADGQPGAPEVRQLLHEHRFLAIRAAAAAAPVDTTTARAPGDTTGAPRPRPQENVPLSYVGRAPGGDSAMAALLGFTLPSQVVYAELSDSLPVGVEHALRLQGVRNLAGILSGIDTVEVVREAPPAAPASPGGAPPPISRPRRRR
jgi:hypothetical protein